jgi:multimeric flavodoxin WrbA
MNAVILNGGPATERGAASRKLSKALEEELRSRGCAVAPFELDDMIIKACRGCFACWLKHPGTCAVRDDEEKYLRALIESDVSVWITPVTFGGYSSTLKKALDRSIPILLPFFIKTHGEIHHPQRYKKRRKLLAVGTLPTDDAEAEKIFRDLVHRNALNMNSLHTDVRVVSERADDAEAAACARDILDAAGIQ